MPSAHRSAAAAAASSAVHPADLGAHSIAALIERTGVDPNAVDDVVFGNVDSVGPQAGCIARTCWLAAGLPQHVPGVTIDRQCGSRPAGRAVRRPGRDVGDDGPRRRRRRAEHEHGADHVGRRRRQGARLRRPVQRFAAVDDPLRQRRGQPVRRRRGDGREVGHLPRGDGGVRRRVPRAGAPRPRRGPLRGRDRAARRPRLRRGPARAELGEDPLAQDADRGRSAHGGGRQPDLRRFGGDADRQRGGGRSATASRRGHGSITCRCSPTIRS